VLTLPAVSVPSPSWTILDVGVNSLTAIGAPSDAPRSYERNLPPPKGSTKSPTFPLPAPMPSGDPTYGCSNETICGNHEWQE
jgi:hypothetical protein